MTRHIKPEGVAFIPWLVAFGEALGYHSKTEWTIPDPVGVTDVDVVWLRQPDEEVALFAFEVPVPNASNAGSAAV